MNCDNDVNEDPDYTEGVRRSMSEPWRPKNHHQNCGCPPCRQAKEVNFMSVTKIACRVLAGAIAALAVIETVAQYCLKHAAH